MHIINSLAIWIRNIWTAQYNQCVKSFGCVWMPIAIDILQSNYSLYRAVCRHGWCSWPRQGVDLPFVLNCLLRLSFLIILLHETEFQSCISHMKVYIVNAFSEGSLVNLWFCVNWECIFGLVKVTTEPTGVRATEEIADVARSLLPGHCQVCATCLSVIMDWGA